MKHVLFLTILTLSNWAMAVQSISGFVGKSNSGYYIIPQSSKIRYTLLAQDPDVTDSLNRLNSGDYISGQGSIDTTNKKIRMDSVDYVGLRKLLGPWVSNDGVMVFQDFSRMKYSPRFAKNDINIVNKLGFQKEFRYTLSPSEGNEWAIFLSDSNSTTFATVEFVKKSITLKIFESESGNIVRTLTLERPER